MSTSSSYDWDVCIVDGYHFDIPSTALVHSLLQRCAVVCNPYRSEPQSRMYIQSMIAYICSVLPHTHIQYTVGTHTYSATTESLLLYYTNENETQPILEVHIVRNNSTICVLHLEYWNNSGGPWPYSDSVTIAIYTAESMVQNIQTLCREHNIQYRIEHASHTPVRPTIWQRLIRYFGL